CWRRRAGAGRRTPGSLSRSAAGAIAAPTSRSCRPRADAAAHWPPGALAPRRIGPCLPRCSRTRLRRKRRSQPPDAWGGDAMEAPYILHMLSPLKHVSPFDVNMALDAGFTTAVPYTAVELGDVASLTQDA